MSQPTTTDTAAMANAATITTPTSTYPNSPPSRPHTLQRRCITMTSGSSTIPLTTSAALAIVAPSTTL